MERDGGGGSEGRREYQVRTADENGMLSLRGLKPGDYKLYAWEDVEQGAPFDPDFLKQYEGQAKSREAGCLGARGGDAKGDRNRVARLARTLRATSASVSSVSPSPVYW